MKSCSREWTPESAVVMVADLAGDVNHVCNFAGRDSSLLDNKNALSIGTKIIDLG